MSEKTKNILAIISVILLSFVVFSIVFGSLFDKLNRVSFANGGDGVQSYVNMEYHIRYDTSYLRCNSMNYPYGEHVFFTNNQPLFSNTVRFISRNITDISGYTLGMLNFMMLFSLLITPIFIYLIFRHFHTGRVLSIIASIAIAFLTPQMDRLGGHYNLSYVCAIPLMILLLLKFFSKPTAQLSFLIFLTMMAGALTHFYLYGFFALLMVFLYTAEFIQHKTITNNRIAALHLFVQLILPFLILQSFYISDHVTDRPAYPWGFLYYRAYPQSVFLPLNKPYAQFLHSFINTSYIDWEGYAIIGTIAFLGFLFFIYSSGQKLLKKQYAGVWQVTDNRLLNILFWASFAGLLYSFGLPFILGLQWLVDFMGPLRQMRGIARFSWVFYYVMNIVTIYWLWTWWKNEKKKFSLVIMAAALIILCYDSWYNIRGRGKWLDNSLPVLTDDTLKMPENQWIKRIDLQKYQAFIPLPYFHIGSENIWIDGGCDIVGQSFAAIKNSGLPCMGVMLSRTSIGQTIENVSLMLGPACDQLNLSRFLSDKPFLLMAAKCDQLNEREKQLIQQASKIDSSGAFYLFELPFHAFRRIADSVYNEVSQEMLDTTLTAFENMKISNHGAGWAFVDYDSLMNGSVMNGNGYFTAKAKRKSEIFNHSVIAADTSKDYYISFWFDHISGDLYPRTTLRINQFKPDGTLLASDSYPVSKNMVMIDHDRVLIEIRCRIKDPNSRVVLILQNKTLRNKTLNIDDLLIRPAGMDLYRKLPNALWKNNRIYRSCGQ